MTKHPVFGKQRLQDFSLESGYIPLNHGSYGIYPKVVGEVLRSYQEKAEAHPDRWMRLEQFPVLEYNLSLVSNLIHCDPKDLGFAANASQAANIILRSYPFQAGDKILYHQTGYVNVNKTLEFLRDHYGVELVVVELNFPLEDDEIVAVTQTAIEQNDNIVMAVIDVLSSLPGVRLPFERLTKLAQQHGILACVDGAHAIGHIPLNLQKLDPDFFFSNCHKWLYTPRGCAIIYVRKSQQRNIHPTTITSAYKYQGDATSFALELRPPTIDTSPFLCIEAALDYRASLGGEEKINAYIHNVTVEGGALVAKILGTCVMENSTGTLTANMVNVQLPEFKRSTDAIELSDSDIVNLYLKKLIYEHHTMASVFKNNGKWWARLCGQIYVDLDDFKKAGEALLAITNEVY